MVATGTAAPGAEPVTATREQTMALMAEAGFVRGSGPPSPEVRENMAQLAKERGLVLPSFGGREHGAGHSEQPAMTIRTVYKLGGTPDSPRPESASVKLGISDGVNTEIIDGLKEGDVLISSAIIPGAATTSAPSANPFGGGPRRF